MKHVRMVSRAASLPISITGGSLSPLESGILVLVTIFFRTWDNYVPVIENLSKYYQKIG